VPVPLPTPETVNLQPPDAAEVQTMVDGVASAVVGAGGSSLAPVQRSLLESLMVAMTGHQARIPDRPSMTPAEFAQSLERRELSFRTRMVQIMLLCALLLSPIPEDVAERIAANAEELGVHDGMVDVARDLAVGSLALARQDFVRNGYEGTWHSDEAAATLHSARELQVWEFSVDDAALAAQWASLESLPSDSIGRKVWELYQARGFTFPGAPESAPPLLAQHDWVHVLADYGTTVESEVEVFGLISRANDDMHAFSLLAMVLALFETGIVPHAAGLFEASPGHFSGDPGMATRLSDALRRGALCYDRDTGAHSIDFLRMDWFAVAHVPCAELRERFHVVAKSEEAVAAGSVGPWERGGISPFQMSAGQAMAATRGVPYDGHGASV
jgi:hypothetical protein